MSKMRSNSSVSCRRLSKRKVKKSRPPCIMWLQKSNAAYSRRALVKFIKSKLKYNSDKDIVCQYMATDNAELEDDDKVAIFPVGWTDMKNMVCHVPAAKCSSTEKSSVFAASQLPAPGGERLFQFVYLTAGEVCGASMPFAIVKGSNTNIDGEQTHQTPCLSESENCGLSSDEISEENETEEQEKIIEELRKINGNLRMQVLEEQRYNVKLLSALEDKNMLALRVKRQEAKINFLSQCLQKSNQERKIHLSQCEAARKKNVEEKKGLILLLKKQEEKLKELTNFFQEIVADGNINLSMYEITQHTIEEGGSKCD